MGKHNIPDSVVRAILMDPDTRTQVIGAKHGVSGRTVALYKRRELDKAARVAKEMRAEGLEPVLWDDTRLTGRLTTEQVAEIRASKLSSAKCAKNYGCSPSMIRMIRTGKAYGV